MLATTPWPAAPEVAFVKSGQLALVQALGEGDDAGVHNAQAEIAITLLELAAAGQIGRRGRFDAVDTGLQVIEDYEPGINR